MRILVVDDSKAQRHIIQQRLGSVTGAEVVGEAGSGPEALYEFTALRPDVVLLDLVMPGMGGEDTLKAILEIDPAANVVIVSSLGTSDAIERCLQAGARSFLQKPFETADLVRTLVAIAVRSPS